MAQKKEKVSQITCSVMMYIWHGIHHIGNPIIVFNAFFANHDVLQDFILFYIQRQKKISTTDILNTYILLSNPNFTNQMYTGSHK